MRTVREVRVTRKLIRLSCSIGPQRRKTMAKGGKGRGGKRGLSRAAASRIQSATAKAHGGKVSKGSFAARVQRAASKKK